jgi:acetyl esterase/lipase
MPYQPNFRQATMLFMTLFLCLWAFVKPVAAQVQEKPQENSQEIFLWPNGAPGFEGRKDEPQKAKDWWVKNIHNPSVTVYKPAKELDKGIGVLVCPGGGHSALVYNSEGRDAAKYLNSLGITAFVLKYRLAREENSPYSLDEHPQEDAYRAMRLIRNRAAEWNIDPERIGMMGFSAGGEVVAMVALDNGSVAGKAGDAIDKESGEPAFIIMVYPGPLGIPEKVSPQAPPAFLLAANDDECCSGTAVDLLVKYREAGVPVEAHLYAQGDHAFNIGQRSELNSIKTWPHRLEDWLNENHFKNAQVK